MRSLVEDLNRPLLEAEARRGTPATEVVAQFVRAFLSAYKSPASISAEIPARVGRRLLLQDTLSATEAAKRYSVGKAVTAEAVKKAVRDRRLIAAKGSSGELLFPTWQFADEGGPVEGLRDVLAELGKSPARGDMFPFTFFLNHNPLTGGKRPIDALKVGHKADVLRAAAAARY